jgi:hypothetical protein
MQNENAFVPKQKQIVLLLNNNNEDLKLDGEELNEQRTLCFFFEMVKNFCFVNSVEFDGGGGSSGSPFHICAKFDAISVLAASIPSQLKLLSTFL